MGECQETTPRFYESVRTSRSVLCEKSSVDLPIALLSAGEELYIQLLHTANYRLSEARFKQRFPDSSVICFYGSASCFKCLRMLRQQHFATDVILLLQSDSPQIDQLVAEFEQFDFIRYVRLCSPYGSYVKSRRIIESISLNEDDFYRQLISIRTIALHALANEHIDVHKNRQEALRCLQEIENYQQLLYGFDFHNRHLRSIPKQPI